MTDYVASLGLSQLGLILVLVIFYLVLGCFIETLSMMVGTVPIVFPIILCQYRPRLVRYLSSADDGVGANHAASGHEPLCRAGYSGARRSGGLVHWYLAVRCCNRHFVRVIIAFPTSSLASKSDVLMNLLIINPNISAATNARIRAIAGALIKAPDKVEVVSAPSGIEFIGPWNNPPQQSLLFFPL